MHGAGGHVLNMAGLAQLLGPERDFYAVVARGVDGVQAPRTDIAEMAEAYLAEIRKVQPHGPYYLSGYCGGGIVAYEMACRLVAQGEQVALLALIDSYHPRLDVRKTRVQRLMRGVSQRGFEYVLGRARGRVQRDRREAERSMQIAMYRLRGEPVPLELRDMWITRAFFQALRKYVPGVYPGRLTVIRAREVLPLLEQVGPELGWTGLARGGIESITIDGHHDTLLDATYVPGLASVLQRCLQQAERAVGAAMTTRQRREQRG